MLPTEPINCPYCGEPIEIVIDDSIDEQQYIEDCSVCCQPIDIAVVVDPQAGITVSVRAENDV